MVSFLKLSAMTYSIVHVTKYLRVDRGLGHNTKYTFYRLKNLFLQLMLQVIRSCLDSHASISANLPKKIVSALRYILKRLEGEKRVSF